MPLPPSVVAVFLVLGASILVGYLGHILFRKYRFSDILVLLTLGILAGPFLHLVDPDLIAPMFQVLAPFGLMLLLFEGGLGLGWKELRHVAPRALGATVGTWLIGAAVLTVIAHYLLGFDPALALLLAVAIAGLGVTALLPLLPQLDLPERARAFITIETTLGSLLNATATTAVVAVILAQSTPAGSFGIVGAKFLVGAACGLLAGLVWARILHVTGGNGFSYALTVGALLVAYVGTETLGGSGYLMALTFGVVVANAQVLHREGRLPQLQTLPETARAPNSEIVFMFRSVYFVYLGLSVSPHVLTAKYALGGLALVGGMLLVRLVAMGPWRATGPDQTPATSALLVSLAPRGLTTAVVASIPVSMGLAGTADFLPYAFFVIVFGNVVTMIGLWIYKRARTRELALEPAGVAG